jgi:3',5'-nucleoside bisphosphate phosphatase
MRIDLHSHTTASDGKLSPDELVRHAAESGLEALAITDHDSIEAYARISNLHALPFRLIPGIEFSSQWQKIDIHILGLNIDLDNATLKNGICIQQRHRHERACQIADKLARALGIDNPIKAVRKLTANDNVGRPHFAEYLVNAGLVKDSKEAFRKFLGIGKKAYVKPQWAGPDEIIGWIRAAGGTAVLAHPARYKLTRTKLIKLIDDFIAAGGQGLEVITGNQTTPSGADLAKLCAQKNLLASCGSDFHGLDQHWARLGQFPALPGSCTPVWSHW